MEAFITVLPVSLQISDKRPKKIIQPKCSKWYDFCDQ